MQDDKSGDQTSGVERPLAGKIKDFARAFLDLRRLPRAFWVINLAFMIDSMAYFGVLTLLTAYLAADVGLSDSWAGLCVSVFTGFVTLFMIGFGGLAERLGIRRGILLAISICLLGRIVYAAAPLVWSGSTLVAVVVVGLVIIALGEGIIQPVSYAGIKHYTDERTSAMGYGLIYAIMNLGIVLIGWISPLIRVPIDDARQLRPTATEESSSLWGTFADWGVSGIMGVNVVCVLLTAVALVVFSALMTKRIESQKVGGDDEAAEDSNATTEAARSWVARVVQYFRDGPFSNARFVFFIFMLLPVQTLFAHQWLTMPLYVLRAYPEGVGDRMEWIVNWINPGIIFLGVPVFTAMTRRTNVYTMMIIGTTVSALPTFLLSTGPSLSVLITYLVVFSIGEALWQPRFLQYAAELAPEGRVGQYMGLANVPWITAKMTTGLYSGYALARYCPEVGPKDTETMWLIYGFIAIISPIGLLLGRSWVVRGMPTKAAADARRSSAA